MFNNALVSCFNPFHIQEVLEKMALKDARASSINGLDPEVSKAGNEFQEIYYFDYWNM